MNYKLIIGEERIEKLQSALGRSSWPAFMQHDAIVRKYWPKLYTHFLKFQFALFEHEKLVGVGNSIPLKWEGEYDQLPDTGIDWAMEKAKMDYDNNLGPNLLVGLQILINPDYKSKGISYQMLQIMKDLAKSADIKSVALPVRPTLKWKYPLISNEDYIGWKNESGEPFDPWLRVHTKSGGKIIRICKKSMNISGTIKEWEEWTGMEFQTSGEYVVDKALVPVKIDRDKDSGSYIEPNVWVVHDIE